tara:strand:- start:466 stop:759 length:294 start_codon:yes stop_codon:yes gene_type:complete
MKAYQVQNLRQIKVKFISPTNNKAAKVKIYEPKRYKDDSTQSKTFSYSYGDGDIQEQAYKILISNGWNVLSSASEVNEYIFLCDNWGEDFKTISELN